ncbi:unnamed protein product [Closterium sp. NIES-53]
MARHVTLIRAVRSGARLGESGNAFLPSRLLAGGRQIGRPECGLSHSAPAERAEVDRLFLGRDPRGYPRGYPRNSARFLSSFASSEADSGIAPSTRTQSDGSPHAPAESPSTPTFAGSEHLDRLDRRLTVTGAGDRAGEDVTTATGHADVHGNSRGNTGRSDAISSADRYHDNDGGAGMRHGDMDCSSGYLSGLAFGSRRKDPRDCRDGDASSDTSQSASDTPYGRERVGDSAACGAAADTTTPHGTATDAMPVVAVEESSVSTALGTASYVTATCRVSIDGPAVSVSSRETASKEAEAEAAAAAAAAAVREVAARLGGSPSVVVAFVSGGGASEAGAPATGTVLEALGREVERAWGRGGGEGSAGREDIPFFGCAVGGGMECGPWGGEGEIMGETHTGGDRSHSHGLGNHGRDVADGDCDGESEGEALEWEEVVMAAAADEVIEGVVLLELIEDADHIIREMAAFAPHEEGRQQGEEDTQEKHEAGEVTGELNCGQFNSTASPATASSLLSAPPFTEPSNSFAESIRAITEGHVAQAEGAVTQRLEAASRRFLGLAEGLQTRLEAPQYKLEGLADSIQERMWSSNGNVQGNELLRAKASVFLRGDGVTERLEGRGEEEREVVVVVCAAAMPGVDVQAFEAEEDSFPDLGGNMAHMVTSNAAHFVLAGTGGPSLPRLLARLHIIFPHSSRASLLAHNHSVHMHRTCSPSPPHDSTAGLCFSLSPSAEQQSSALQSCFTHFIRHLTLPLPPATSLHASSPPSPTTASAAPSIDMSARGIAPAAPWLRVK